MLGSNLAGRVMLLPKQPQSLARRLYLFLKAVRQRYPILVEPPVTRGK
jgi:hypothetical protein